MFPMTVTIHNQTQLAALMSLIGGMNAPQNAEHEKDSPKPEAKQEAPAKPGKPSAATTAEASRTAEAAPAAAPEKKAEPSAPAADPVTYNQVSAVILELSKRKGRDAAIGLLKEFGAAKGPELKPEQYAEFATKAKALLS